MCVWQQVTDKYNNTQTKRVARGVGGGSSSWVGGPGQMTTRRPRRVAVVAGTEFPLAITQDGDAFTVTVDGGKAMSVTTLWRPGDQLADLVIAGERHAVKTGRSPGGFRLRQRGLDARVLVLNPRAAELNRLMPEKAAPDTSNLLLCPMPGLIVSIAVEEGQEVQEGQTLAIVEAMKMENVLRAEKRAVVKKIPVKAGDSLAVDEIIMEFEK